MLHLAREGVLPVAAAVPAAARRHDVEVPGDVRVPRAGGRRARHGAARPPEPRVRRARASTRSTTARRCTPTCGRPRASSRRSTSTGFDVAFGGARRDEEKSRAKERVFSIRSAQHRWDPKQQRPELWRIYNVRRNHGETHAGCSRCRTGPSSTSGSTSTSRRSRSCRCTSPPPRPVVERDGDADHGRRRPDAAARRRGARAAQRPVPDARLLPADRRGRERGRHADRRSSRRCC